MANRGLSVPPEPSDVKKLILEAKARLGVSDEIDWNSLAVWYGNRVPKYLWGAWKNALEEKGFTWQSFLKVMRYRTDDALLWVDGRMSWENFVRRVQDSLEGPLGEMIKRR